MYNTQPRGEIVEKAMHWLSTSNSAAAVGKRIQARDSSGEKGREWNKRMKPSGPKILLNLFTGI